MRRIKKCFYFLLVIGLLFGAAVLIRTPLAGVYRNQVIPLEYDSLVYTYAKQYKVPPSVIFAVIKCESGFESDAQSHAGALGLMQLMPDTFEWLRKKCGGDYSPEQITDPEANIHVGVYYLSWLYERFSSWELVYAAYNAGHNRVKNWMEDNSLYDSDGKLQIPIKETANYVNKVSYYRAKYLEHYEIIRVKEKNYE